MNIRKQIRVQRLQDKNRMVGQTFNPQGHTGVSLKGREMEEVARIELLCPEEFEKLKNNYIAIDRWKKEDNIFTSNSFEHNVFIRNFNYS